MVTGRSLQRKPIAGSCATRVVEVGSPAIGSSGRTSSIRSTSTRRRTRSCESARLRQPRRSPDLEHEPTGAAGDLADRLPRATTAAGGSSAARMQELIEESRLVVGRYNKARTPGRSTSGVKKASVPKAEDGLVGDAPTTPARTALDAARILGSRDAFPFPKSIYAVRDCLAAVVRDRPEALVVDFFAGSGTTLHATALLNAGGRRCTAVRTRHKQRG